MFLYFFSFRHGFKHNYLNFLLKGGIIHIKTELIASTAFHSGPLKPQKVGLIFFKSPVCLGLICVGVVSPAVFSLIPVLTSLDFLHPLPFSFVLLQFSSHLASHNLLAFGLSLNQLSLSISFFLTLV